MAIGDIPTVASLNALVEQLAQILQSWVADADELYAYTTAQGAAGLETIWFASADATNFITMSDYMGTIAGVCSGTATQASEFNFMNALTAVTGPT